ncbi:MAG: YHS domain-containing protein [Bryobacterales bacterium]|nr:YHS domain-containing protein [Bryobacterales bacterium]
MNRLIPRRTMRLLLSLSLCALLPSSLAIQPLRATPPQFFLDSNGLAIGGFDLVSYFTEGRAQRGSERFQAEYKGATFLFSSEANRNLFQANQEMYLPQFHGYCAYALAAGKLRQCDPRRFSVDGGKLYLFSSERVRRQWSLTEADLLAKAVEVWRGLFD